MQSRARLGLSLLPLVAALLAPACKTVDKEEDLVDASLIPPALSVTAPVPAATTAAPIVPAPTAAPPPAATTPKLDAGTPTDAGAAAVDAGKVADAGAAANGTMKACADKC